MQSVTWTCFCEIHPRLVSSILDLLFYIFKSPSEKHLSYNARIIPLALSNTVTFSLAKFYMGPLHACTHTHTHNIILLTQPPPLSLSFSLSLRALPSPPSFLTLYSLSLPLISHALSIWSSRIHW